MKYILNFFVQEIAKPLSRRVSSAAGVALASFGASTDVITSVETAMLLVSGFAIDLILSNLSRSN